MRHDGAGASAAEQKEGPCLCRQRPMLSCKSRKYAGAVSCAKQERRQPPQPRRCCRCLHHRAAMFGAHVLKLQGCTFTEMARL